MSNELNTPTETTAPVADTTSGLWTFTTPASRLFLNNRSGQTIYIRFNGAAASVATHDLALVDGAFTNPVLRSEDVGVGTFGTVSVWFPATATVGAFNIRGA